MHGIRRHSRMSRDTIQTQTRLPAMHHSSDMAIDIHLFEEGVQVQRVVVEGLTAINCNPANF